MSKCRLTFWWLAGRCFKLLVLIFDTIVYLRSAFQMVLHVPAGSALSTPRCGRLGLARLFCLPVFWLWTGSLYAPPCHGPEMSYTQTLSVASSFVDASSSDVNLSWGNGLFHLNLDTCVLQQWLLPLPQNPCQSVQTPQLARGEVRGELTPRPRQCAQVTGAMPAVVLTGVRGSWNFSPLERTLGVLCKCRLHGRPLICSPVAPLAYLWATRFSRCVTRFWRQVPAALLGLLWPGSALCVWCHTHGRDGRLRDVSLPPDSLYRWRLSLSFKARVSAICTDGGSVLKGTTFHSLEPQKSGFVSVQRKLAWKMKRSL